MYLANKRGLKKRRIEKEGEVERKGKRMETEE
jgi:hypothetical protein